MPDIHIIPNGDRWDVKVENGDVVGTYATQAEAEREGKAWARERGGGEVFTHRDEGEFSPHPQGRRRLASYRNATAPFADVAETHARQWPQGVNDIESVAPHLRTARRMPSRHGARRSRAHRWA